MEDNIFAKWQKQWKESMKELNKKIKEDLNKLKSNPINLGAAPDPKLQWEQIQKNIERSFEKWKRDWENLQKENAQKMAAAGEELKKRWEQGVKEFSDFIETQRNLFKLRMDELRRSFEESIREQDEFNREFRKAFEEGWRNFVEGQRKVQENYFKMQNRLWWKGYVNFLATMLVIVGVIIAIVEILRYFGIMR